MKTITNGPERWKGRLSSDPGTRGEFPCVSLLPPVYLRQGSEEASNLELLIGVDSKKKKSLQEKPIPPSQNTRKRVA